MYYLLLNKENVIVQVCSEYSKIDDTNVLVGDTVFTNITAVKKISKALPPTFKPFQFYWKDSDFEEIPVTPVAPLFPKSEAKISRIDFYNLFSENELVAIYTAAKQNVALEIMLDKVRASETIDMSSPVIIARIEAMEADGLINAGRAREILT